MHQLLNMTLYLCMKQKYGNSTMMNTNRKNIHGDTPSISFFQICFHRKLMYQYLKFMQVFYIKILYFYYITCIKTFSSLNVEIYISGRIHILIHLVLSNTHSVYECIDQHTCENQSNKNKNKNPTSISIMLIHKYTVLIAPLWIDGKMIFRVYK